MWLRRCLPKLLLRKNRNTEVIHIRHKAVLAGTAGCIWQRFLTRVGQAFFPAALGGGLFGFLEIEFELGVVAGPEGHASDDQQERQQYGAVEQAVDGGDENCRRERVAHVGIADVRSGEGKPDGAQSGNEQRRFERDQADAAVHAEDEKPQAPRALDASLPPVPLTIAEDWFFESGVDVAFVLFEPPSQRSLADFAQVAVDGVSDPVFLYEVVKGDPVADAKDGESEDAEDEYDAEGAGEMAGVDEDEWNEGEQKDNGAGGLAEEGDNEQRDGGGCDGNSEDGLGRFTSPEPDRDKGCGGHPDAELVAVFEQADGTVADPAVGAVGLEWLVAVEPVIDPWPSREFEEANGDVEEAANDQRLSDEPKGIGVGEIEASDEVRAAPGEDLVKPSGPCFLVVLGVGDAGEEWCDEPHAHGEVPDSETESLETGAVEEENAEDSCESEDCGFGDEVVGFEAGSDDPVGEGVRDWRNVIGCGKDGPTSHKIDQQRFADGHAPVQDETDGNPSAQGD